ncbi:MAG: PIN domain-containing protein [Gammaproteobacteria bacterium]
MAAVFVDTSIFVYARDAGEPEKQPAAASWIESLWVEQSGRTSLQALDEYYVTVTQRLTPGMAHGDAWADVRALLAWNPQPLDREVMLLARDIELRYDLGWRDSLIVAAAQLQNCALLLTENLTDGWACDGLTVCNPFNTRVEDERERYVATPVPVSRHRSPGRPRRK